MRAIFGLVLVGLLGAAGCSSTGGAECLAGLEACDGECVNTSVDPTNCGFCGNYCPTGQRCESGFCVDSCSGGLTDCSGVCVDTRNNPSNCGSCGNICPSGQYCSGGVCTGGSCPAGLVECSGRCVDTDNDPANCGSCGRSCDGAPCFEGDCMTGCPAPLTDCSGACVDTDKDPANCGECGNVCPGGQSCTDGLCVLSCPDGLTDCSGTCVDTSSSRSHCGRCDNACPAGQVCDGGRCSETGCSGGLTDCSGACVDTDNDRNNCGRCGVVCPAGQACVDGRCGVLCPEGQVECSGSCVTLATDSRNCGACGVVCRTDQVCRGTCVCPDGRNECSGACVDLASDPANCGSCGRSCPAGQACVSRSCTLTCPGGTTACGGFCVDTSSSHSHCGRCDNACAADESCIGGACVRGGGVPGDTCSTAIDISGGGRFTGTTVGAGANYSGSCGGNLGREVVYSFTLTATSDVFLSTFGSSFDTLMYVRRGTCGSGTDIACNDDVSRGSFFSLQSELILLDQPAGTYYVFLDAFSSSGAGPYVLDAYFTAPSGRQGDACGEPIWIDIESATSVSSNTCHWLLWDFRDDTRACRRGSGGKDAVYYFVVRTTRTVTFETCGLASWDTILDLRSVCNDESDAGRVACNDDGCVTGLQSSVTATLEPGVYYLWIDGYSESACGSYEIAIR